MLQFFYLVTKSSQLIFTGEVSLKIWNRKRLQVFIFQKIRGFFIITRFGDFSKKKPTYFKDRKSHISHHFYQTSFRKTNKPLSNAALNHMQYLRKKRVVSQKKGEYFQDVALIKGKFQVSRSYCQLDRE